MFLSLLQDNKGVCQLWTTSVPHDILKKISMLIKMTHLWSFYLLKQVEIHRGTAASCIILTNFQKMILISDTGCVIIWRMTLKPVGYHWSNHCNRLSTKENKIDSLKFRSQEPHASDFEQCHYYLFLCGEHHVSLNFKRLNRKGSTKFLWSGQSVNEKVEICNTAKSLSEDLSISNLHYKS